MVELFNMVAEQSLLGAVLADNRQMGRVGGLLDAADFSEALHQEIWAGLVEVIGNGTQATMLTLPYLRQRCDDAGMPGYLAKLAGIGASVLDTRSLALEVSGLAKRRMMLDVAEKMKLAAADFSRTEAEHIGEAVKQLSSAKTSTYGMSGVALAKQLYAELDIELPCHSSGFSLLDNAMAGGLYEQRLYVFSGRPKSGKTMTACSISNAMGKAGIPHVFIAAEMGIKQIHQRNIAADLDDCAIQFLKKRGSFEHTNFKRSFAELLKDYKTSAYFEDAPGISFDELRTLCANHVRKGAKGIVLDGLWLVQGKNKGENDAVHVAKISDWLAAFAKRENIFAVATYQLNRDNELLGSDGLLRAADQIYRIHRPNEQLPGIWFEMRESRYTPGCNIGSESNCLIDIYKGSCIKQN